MRLQQSKKKVLEISEKEFHDIAIDCAKELMHEDAESESVLVDVIGPMMYASLIAKIHSRLFNKEE